MSWVKNVMVAIDRLGNAIAGGNPLATISGRTGYHSKHTTPPLQAYWRFLEMVIDFAFHPVDGTFHCYKTYLKEQHLTHNHGSDLMRAILGLLVIGCCFFIAIFCRLYVFVVPQARFSKSSPKLDEETLNQENELNGT